MVALDLTLSDCCKPFKGKQVLTADNLSFAWGAGRPLFEDLGLTILSGERICIVGKNGRGKTTLLNALSAFIPETDRVLTVEDTRELRIVGDNHVHLEAPIRRKQADSQHVDLAFLIKTTLRMKPTRIIVGEIRDAGAATAFLHAINTGHSAASTIHANSPVEALWRLETLALSAGETSELAVSRQLRAAVDLVVQLERSGSTRRISAIAGIDELEDS